MELTRTSTITDVSGIQWTLSRPVLVGQFTTGSYCIVLPPGDTVQVTAISPNPTQSGARYIHGSQKRPSTRRLSPTVNRFQGHDSDVNFFSLSSRESLPITLSVGDSLSSTESVTASSCTDLRGVQTPQSRCKTDKAAILTCLSTSSCLSQSINQNNRIFHENMFRPTYTAIDSDTSEPPYFQISQIDWDRLPALPMGSNPPTPDWAGLTRTFERVAFHHVSDFSGRQSHPVKNMLNYYRDINTEMSKAAAALISNLGTQQQKIDLAKGIVQIGIDAYSVTRNGYSDAALPMFPITLAGFLLDYKPMMEWRSDTTTHGPVRTSPKETQQTYYEGGKTLWRMDFGDPHETIPITSWTDPRDEFLNEQYRRAYASAMFVGQAVATRQLAQISPEVETGYGNTAYFDYIARWMENDESARTAAIITQMTGRTGNPNPGGTGFARGSLTQEAWDNYGWAFTGTPPGVPV